MELKRGISRFFSSMNKVNKLQSGYLEASAEVMALKESRRSIKEKLRRVRDEVEMIDIDKINTLKKGERKLLKADKRTTIDGLEHLLERTRNQIKKLERIGDRAFEKREKLKAKAVKEAGFEADYYGGDSSSIVVVNQVDDVAAVAKMMELLRPFHHPVCQIGDEVEVGSSDAIKEAALKLKVKLDDGGIVIAEATSSLEAKVVEDGGAGKKLDAKIKVGAKSNAMKMKAVR